MIPIKFSHRYVKMPADVSNTHLAGLIPFEDGQLSSGFIEYDTRYIEGTKIMHYKLPPGKKMLLLLISETIGIQELWSTIRSFDESKYAYYSKENGKPVQIVIQ